RDNVRRSPRHSPIATSAPGKDASSGSTWLTLPRARHHRRSGAADPSVDAQHEALTRRMGSLPADTPAPTDCLSPAPGQHSPSETRSNQARSRDDRSTAERVEYAHTNL